MERINTPISVKNIGAALVPYVMLAIGIFILHNAWAALVGFHLGMVIILLWEERGFSFRGYLQSSNNKVVIINTLGGAAAGLLIYLFWPVLGMSQNINGYAQSIGLTSAMWPYFIAYFILINPWVEEFFWRGYLGSNSKGLTFSDVFFAGYHIMLLAGQIKTVWLIATFLILVLTAWVWRQSDRLSQGLTASIISHFAADTAIILVIYYMVITNS